MVEKSYCGRREVLNRRLSCQLTDRFRNKCENSHPEAAEQKDNTALRGETKVQ